MSFFFSQVSLFTLIDSVQSSSVQQPDWLALLYYYIGQILTRIPDVPTTQPLAETFYQKTVDMNAVLRKETWIVAESYIELATIHISTNPTLAAQYLKLARSRVDAGCDFDKPLARNIARLEDLIANPSLLDSYKTIKK